MTNPSVLAVVLNWNSAAYVCRAVAHLRAQRVPPSQVLVIDNGSKDSSVADLRAMTPPCEVLTLAVNRGFAGGMNVGLQKAVANGFDYVWLLNSDAFAHPDCLQMLLQRMSGNPRLWMTTPRLVSENGVEQHAGGVVDWTSGDCAHLPSASLTGPLGDAHWLTGTAPLIRVAAVPHCGGFDPEFFAYWEDVDLSIRVRKAGGHLAAVPAAEVVHVGGASGGYASPFSQYLMTRNAWLLLDRHAPRGSRSARWLRFTARALRTAQIYEVQGLDAVRRAVLSAVTAARRGQFGAPKKLDACGWFEKMASTHPTRFSSLLDGAAAVAERTWALTHEAHAPAVE